MNAKLKIMLLTSQFIESDFFHFLCPSSNLFFSGECLACLKKKENHFSFRLLSFFSIKKIINVFEFQISKMLNKYCGGKLKVPKADRLDVVSGDRILFK